MPDFKEIKQTKIAAFTRNIFVFYMVGLVCHLLPFTRPLMLLITPCFLTIFAMLVIFFAPYSLKNFRWLSWLLLTCLLTLAAEIIGVNTGILFGSYSYGSILGIKLKGAPLLIGFNWVIVIYGLINLAGKITPLWPLQILLTGLFGFIFDFVMEPVAIALDYWQWEGGVIPLKNYLTWVGIAMLFALMYNLLGLKKDSAQARVYVLVQFGFFCILALFFLLSEKATSFGGGHS